MPNSHWKLYSAPRRFDLATMMAVTLAYALLFGALRLIRIQPIDVIKVAGFLTCVGIGQAVLFLGKKPRLSSVLVGVVYLVGIYVVYAMRKEASMLPGEPSQGTTPWEHELIEAAQSDGIRPARPQAKWELGHGPRIAPHRDG